MVAFAVGSIVATEAWVAPPLLETSKTGKLDPATKLQGKGTIVKAAIVSLLENGALLAQKTGGDDNTQPDVTRLGKLGLNNSTLISNGSLARSYQLSLSRGGRVTLELDSDDFDAYLRLLDDQGNLIAENDDRSDFNFNSRLDESLDAGRYTVMVSTYGVLQEGRYELELMGKGELIEASFPNPTDSSLVPLDIPQTIASLSNSDASSSSVGTSYRSVVQLYVGQGAGSGTLLTSDGLFLTNFHVLTEDEDSTELTNNSIYIGLAIEPDRAVTPLFRGTIQRTAEEEDLALVKISSDLLGNPLPKNLQFDTVPLGDADSVKLGDRVIVLGFPGTTSIQAGGASYLTLTDGVVSAILPRNGVRHDFISDALVNAGNSGGAALNSQGELIAVPSSNVSDTSVGPGDFDSASVLRAVSAIPQEWMSLIK